jgi:hypothetical protein
MTVKENDSITNFSNLIKKVEEIKAAEQKSEPSMPTFVGLSLVIMLNQIRALRDTYNKVYIEMITQFTNLISMINQDKRSTEERLSVAVEQK